MGSCNNAEGNGPKPNQTKDASVKSPDCFCFATSTTLLAAASWTPQHQARHTPLRHFDKSLNESINLCVCKLPGWIDEHVGQPEILPLVFAVFSKPLPGHHDGHRRLGDQVVAERAQKDAAKPSVFMRRANGKKTHPFNAFRPLDPRTTSVGSRKSICQSTVSNPPQVSRMFRNLRLL